MRFTWNSSLGGCAAFEKWVTKIWWQEWRGGRRKSGNISREKFAGWAGKAVEMRAEALVLLIFASHLSQGWRHPTLQLRFACAFLSTPKEWRRRKGRQTLLASKTTCTCRVVEDFSLLRRKKRKEKMSKRNENIFAARQLLPNNF